MESIVAFYGDTLLVLDETHTKIPRIKSNPKYRMPFCHQSVFTKTELLKKYHFDTSFKICADNDFFTKIYHEGLRFHYVNAIVSIYDIHGISSKPSWRFFIEEFRIIARINKLHLLPFSLGHIWNCIKYLIKSILPHFLSTKIQSRYNAK